MEDQRKWAPERWGEIESGHENFKNGRTIETRILEKSLNTTP